MKKRWLDIVLILIFLIGLSVMLYPTISNYVNEKRQTRAIQSYDIKIDKSSEEELKKMWLDAVDYNRRLHANPFSFYKPAEVSGYDDVLNATGNGMIGYIYIEKVHVALAIYHGTSDEILQFAVGHMEGSSLPIGGEGSHCVLSGHRGLPSAKLFTEIDKLEVGDKFTLNILDKILTYEVDQILIKEPDEIEDLLRVSGKDYCTLLTCTPYGINTHRLLVRGHRVETQTDELITVFVPSDATKISPLIIAPLLAVPIIIVLFVYIIFSGKRKKKGEEHEKEN